MFICCNYNFYIYQIMFSVFKKEKNFKYNY